MLVVRRSSAFKALMRLFPLSWKSRPTLLCAALVLCALLSPTTGGAQSWAPAKTVPVGPEPISSLATADLLGNGTSEVLGVTGSGRLLLFGNGGTLTAGEPIDAGGTVLSVVTGGFDSASHDDVLALERVSTGLVLVKLPNVGAGVLGAPVAIPFPGLLSQDCRLYAGDVNGDGALDLVLGCPSAGLLWVGLNREQGSFEFQPFKAVGPRRQVLQLGVGDFDGDGRADILVESAGADGSIRTDLMRAKSTGGFSVQQGLLELSTGTVAVASLAGHSGSDIVQSADRNSLAVYLNRGDGSFKSVAVQNPQTCAIHAMASGNLAATVGGKGLDLVASADCQGSESLILFANNAQSSVSLTPSEPTTDASGNLTLSVSLTSDSSPEASGTVTIETREKARAPVVNGVASFPISLVSGNNPITITYTGDDEHSAAEWQGLIVWGGAAAPDGRSGTQPISGRPLPLSTLKQSITAAPALATGASTSSGSVGPSSTALDDTSAISGLTLLPGTSESLPAPATSRVPIFSTADGRSVSAASGFTTFRQQPLDSTYRTIQASVSQKDPNSPITYPGSGNMVFLEDGALISSTVTGTSTYGISAWTKGQCVLSSSGWSGSQCGSGRFGPLDVAYQNGATFYTAAFPLPSTVKQIQANYSYVSSAGKSKLATAVLNLAATISRPKPLCTGRTGCTGTGSTGTAVINSGPTGTVAVGSTVTFTVSSSGATCVVGTTPASYQFTVSDGADSCSISNVLPTGGSCSFAVRTTSGTHNVIATVGNSYCGTGAQSTAYSMTVAPSSPSIAVSCSPSSIPYGQSSICSSNVSGGYSPSGSESWTINGAGWMSTGPNGSAGGFNITPPGSYTIGVTYSGDAYNNAASASTTLNIARATPALAISSSASSVPSGAPVTITAQVSNTGAGATPTGAIYFFDNGNNFATAPLSGGVASITISNLTIGSHSMTFGYGGDANFNNVGSGATAVQVTGSLPTLLDVFASPAAVTVGAPVSLRAVVDTVGAQAATGSVTYSNGGSLLGTVSVPTVTTTNLSPYTIVGAHGDIGALGGTVTYTANSQVAPDGTTTAETVNFPAFPSAGTYGFAGQYSNVTPADGSTYTFSVWLKAPVPTQVTMNMVQACGANSGSVVKNVGATWQRYSFTLTMTAPCSGVLIIRLTENGPSPAAVTYAWGAQLEQAGLPGPFVPTNGAAATGTGAVATLTTTSLPVGSDSITATFSGDAQNLASTGGPAVVQVAKTAPTLTVSSSLNPSLSGQAVTFTASLAGGFNSTGSVTFLDGGASIGTVTLGGSTATFTTNALPVGTHSITASYTGDADNSSATSSTVSQVVNKGTAPISLSSSSNPSTYGQAVTITATLPANATGTITFMDGATTIGSATLSGGSATFTTSGLSVGTHSITTSYAGDANYNAATSSVLSQVVNKAALTMNVTSSLNPSKYNQSIILTVTAHGGGIVPTGTVSVMDGGNSLGTLTLTPDGEAAITTSTLAAGIHTFTFTYNGDGNYY